MRGWSRSWRFIHSIFDLGLFGRDRSQFRRAAAVHLTLRMSALPKAAIIGISVQRLAVSRLGTISKPPQVVRNQLRDSHTNGIGSNATVLDQPTARKYGFVWLQLVLSHN